MKICHTVIIMLIIIGQSGLFCSANNITFKTESATLPILKLSVIDIATEGIVNIVHGRARLLKNGSKEYKEVIKNDHIGYDDILELGKGSNITITFIDGSHIYLDSTQKTKWFTFKNTDRNP